VLAGCVYRCWRLGCAAFAHASRVRVRVRVSTTYDDECRAANAVATKDLHTLHCHTKSLQHTAATAQSGLELLAAELLFHAAHPHAMSLSDKLFPFLSTPVSTCVECRASVNRAATA
jgi:hypothetical protein